MLRRLALAAAVTTTALAACSPSPPASKGPELVIAVNAPFSKAPFIGTTILHGAQLAVNEINAAGGVTVGAKTYTLRLQRFDNALSPARALDNVRNAIAAGVVAIVDEGTGLDATWREAGAAHVPIGVVYQGGEGMVDAEARPNVYRIAPTDHGTAFRYAEYLAPKGLKVALVSDDSDYGQRGKIAFDDAFGHIPDSVAAEVSVPAASAAIAPQVLEARRAGATALLVWGRSSTIAQVITAARTAEWDVPIYTPGAGEDPLIRQQLAAHPEWIDGLTFATGRMTAEVGPAPFLAFQAAYTKAFGRDPVGVKTRAGKPVFEPPDFAMYAYDFVRLLGAAITKIHATEGAALVAGLELVDVKGANGDERGFNEVNHEGVVDDDVYFGVFHDMTYVPVQDDPLSATLDVIDQT